MRIDHVAIAVNNVEEAAKTFEKVLKVNKKEIMTVEHEKVKLAMLQLEDTRIELLEPLGDDSPIKKFLAEKGEGIHHVSITTDDIERDVKHAQDNGVKIVGGIRLGSYGSKMTFVHPKSLHGVLTELYEKHED